MIADERMDLTAVPRRLDFQVAEQIDHPLGVGPAVEQVARLHEHRAAAAPAAIAADEMGLAEDGDERVEGAVNVANRDDSLGRGELAGRCRRLRLSRRTGRRQRENSKGGREAEGNRDVVE